MLGQVQVVWAVEIAALGLAIGDFLVAIGIGGGPEDRIIAQRMGEVDPLSRSEIGHTGYGSGRGSAGGQCTGGLRR